MPTQRDTFLDKLYEIAKDDRRVILLSNDFGAPSLDKWRRDLPNQLINTGIAEQNTINVARGLAMAGRTVFTYAILPFYMRAYEQIKHLCMQNLNVNMVGVGAGFAYSTAGPTHHALEDIAAMRALPNLAIFNASDTTMARAFARIAYNELGPKYIRLDRYTLSIYPEKADFSEGYVFWTSERDVTIIASGYMVQHAFKIADNLEKRGAGAQIIDLYKIKPFSPELIVNLALGKPIVTIEESFLNGGIGSILAEALALENKSVPLLRIGVPDEYCFSYAGREELHRLCGLDVDSITKRILKWLGAKNG